MNKKVTLLASTALAGVLVLTACSSNSGSSDKAAAAKAGDFKIAYNNPKKAISGGDLQMATVSDSPFKAQWMPTLSDDATFGTYMEAPSSAMSLFFVDKNYQYTDNGPAKIKYDYTKKTATITLRDDLKWSDGSPVIAKDVELPYEQIANPAYGSNRYNSQLELIAGMKEYHEGKAKTISGITYPDGEKGKVVKIQFTQMAPGMTTSGNGYIWENAAPSEYLKDVAPKDLASSPKTTTQPLSMGPWAVSKIVDGEAIKYVPNKYYWGKKPKLDSITYATVSTPKTIASLSAHKYDEVTDMATSMYKQVKSVKGYETIGQPAFYISLKVFNLGHYDEKTSTNIQDRKTPLQDKKVRQAVGYAMNTADVLKKFSNGLNQPANSVVPPVYNAYYDKNAKGYEKQDLDKANKLLDEAGWKMNKKTGYREKDGKELSLVYMARVSDANAETTAQNYIQQWKKVGIKVSLWHDKLIDFNAWLEKTAEPKADDWDITDEAWALTAWPSQSSIFGTTTPYNIGHFNDPKLTKEMANIDSSKAIKDSYMKKEMNAFQKDMNDAAYVIPYSFRIDYQPINKRVVGANLDPSDNQTWAELGVSSKVLATK